MKLSIKTNNDISRTTGETALVRALQFLRAVGSDAGIMEALKQTGFDEEALRQGWSLVLSAYAAGNGITAPALSESPLAEATSKVESWQSAMFVRSAAVLRRFHPEQAAFVFENLEMGSGIGAVPAVATFLDRLDALESSPDRKATRKSDHAALAVLEQRGVTKQQRKEMHSLVKWIESTPAQPTVTAAQSPRDAALFAVYEWVQDWSECARTVITRRDQLIRLGIGKRRSRKSDVQPVPAPVPAPQPPIVVAPQPVVTDPSLIQMARPVLALPAKANGATPGSVAIPMSGGDAH